MSAMFVYVAQQTKLSKARQPSEIRHEPFGGKSTKTLKQCMFQHKIANKRANVVENNNFTLSIRKIIMIHK